MKKKIFCSSVGILMVLLFIGGLLTAPAYAKKIKLTYANFMPVGVPLGQMERWVEEVQRRTGGKVEIKTFPGGTLLKGPAMADGVAQGQADIGHTTMAYQPGRFIIENAVGLPLGIPSCEVGSRVFWEIFKKYKPKSFEGLKVLSVMVFGPNDIMTQVPVRKMEDLKGLEIRASGHGATTLSAWGAVPVGMPMPATPEALQKGVVKGMYTAIDNMVDWNLTSLLPYSTKINEVYWAFATFMNPDTWNSLPEDVKKVMDDLALDHCIWSGKRYDDRVAEVTGLVEKMHNVEIIKLTQKEDARMHQKLLPLIDQWIKDANAKGLPGEQIIADYRALIKKYSKP